MKTIILSLTVLCCLLFCTSSFADNDPANDVNSGAESFPLDSSVSGSIGKVYSINPYLTDAYDWYTITIPVDGVINFTFVGDGTSYIIQNYALFSIYDTDHPIFGVAYLQNSGGFLAFGLSAGTYYVLISQRTQYKGYTITNTFTPAPYNNDVELNDFYYQAHNLPLNSTTTGHLHFRYGDEALLHSGDNDDWYAFTTPSTDSFSMQYIATPRDDGTGYPPLTMTIYNTNNLGNHYGLSTGTGSVLYTNPAMPAGNYVVDLQSTSFTNAGHSYQLINYYKCEPSPITIAANGGTTFCSGGSVLLSSIGSFNSYLWSDAETTPTINVNASGNYSLQAIDIYGCTNASNTIPVTVNPNPTVSINANGATTFCIGGSVKLIPNGSFSSYYWSNNKTTSTIKATQSGNYYVTVTNAFNCSGVSNTIPVTVQGSSVKIVPSGTVTMCAGNTTVLKAKPADSLATLQWYKDSAAITGAIKKTYKATTAGKYQVQTTLAGCTFLSPPTTVVINCSAANAVAEAIAAKQYSFKFFPNPASDHVTIMFNSNESNCSTLKVLNSFGQVMIGKNLSLNKGSNQIILSTGSLAEGIYLCRINVNNISYTSKMVIEK